MFYISLFYFLILITWKRCKLELKKKVFCFTFALNMEYYIKSLFYILNDTNPYVTDILVFIKKLEIVLC